MSAALGTASTLHVVLAADDIPINKHTSCVAEGWSANSNSASPCSPVMPPAVSCVPPGATAACTAACHSLHRCTAAAALYIAHLPHCPMQLPAGDEWGGG